MLQREYLHSLFGWKIGFKSLTKHKIIWKFLFSLNFHYKFFLLFIYFMMDALLCSFDPLSMLLFLSFFILSFGAASTLHNDKLIFDEHIFILKTKSDTTLCLGIIMSLWMCLKLLLLFFYSVLFTGVDWSDVNYT